MGNGTSSFDASGVLPRKKEKCDMGTGTSSFDARETLARKGEKSSVDTETSSFDASEMLASFLSSTPLLPQSWWLCKLADANFPESFLTEQIDNVGYVCFSGVQSVGESVPVCRSLVPLVSFEYCNELFAPLLRQNEGEEPVMVHQGMLQVFLSMYGNPSFQNQMLELTQKSKSIVITGHSVGGTTASLAALWLLCTLQSTYTNISVICITFGSPLLGNASLSRAILRETWGGNFCHVVSKHDVVPRLLLAPQVTLTPQLHSLILFWRSSMVSPQFIPFAVQPSDEIFRVVLGCLKMLAQAKEDEMKVLFWPFGNYFFCSEEGAICVDNATSVVRMMYLLFSTSSAGQSIEDHLKYGDYVWKVSSQVLEKRSFAQKDLPESSYEATVALWLQSAGISCQEPAAMEARECLKGARQMGRTPNLNFANLSIKIAQITPYIAEVEFYKGYCDRSDDQMGYYDSFKQRGASKREARMNMNRIKLAQFWDNVIIMLENNQLPLDFLRGEKWVNASQFYMLLVEPLDIAEYYRTEMHRIKGPYISHGRERRYQIFDKWWKERPAREETSIKRSKFAGFTQDTCFWARVEEAGELLKNIRTERDSSKATLLWESLSQFEKYANRLVEKKEVSQDVVAKNSSYSFWLKDNEELKSQVKLLCLQYPNFMDEVVP